MCPKSSTISPNWMNSSTSLKIRHVVGVAPAPHDPTVLSHFNPPDVIGIISEVGEVSTIPTKTNRTVSVTNLNTSL